MSSNTEDPTTPDNPPPVDGYQNLGYVPPTGFNKEYIF